MHRLQISDFGRVFQTASASDVAGRTNIYFRVTLQADFRIKVQVRASNLPVL